MADDPFAQYVAHDADPFAAYAADGPHETAPPEVIRAVSRRRVREQTDQAAPKAEPDWKTNLGAMMESAAHPQTAGDMVGMLLPGQVEGALRTAGLYGRAMKQGMQGRPSGVTGLLSVPTRAYRALKSSFPSEMAKEVEAFTGPKMPTVAPTGPRILTRSPDLLDAALQDARTARATTPTAAASQPGLSAADRAALVKQGYPAEAIAKIEAQAAKPAPMPSHAPTSAPGPEFQPVDAPVAQPAATRGSGPVPDQPLGLQPGFSPRDVADAATQMQRENPNIVAEAEQMRQRAALKGPRIRTGAERVGREAGMTKEAVREATGPVLDEAVGEASPILPKQALTKIIDDMKALAPGADREAYVARATSGKTKWQVENIRRTLEHLGLVVPVAVSVREGLERLMSSHGSEN
jgi:hypothetical protein